MNEVRSAPLERPPFYARIAVEAGEGTDAGQYSEAVATLTSVALLKPSFLGFESDLDAEGREILIAYFKSHGALQLWLHEAGELFPYSVSIENVIAGTGCLWHWLGDEEQEERRYASGIH